MKSFIIVFSLLLLHVFPAFAEKPVLVGVLEQPQSSGTAEYNASRDDISSRILFVKDGPKWRALGASLPSLKWDIKSLKWTVASDGRSLGTVQVKEPASIQQYINDWFYRRDKLHGVESANAIPRISNKSKSFSGWCSTPNFRPLVIVSMPNFKDPEMWKPFEPGNSYKQRLYPFLRVAIGRLNLIRCLYEPTYHSIPYDFKPLETVLYKSYRSSKGNELICAGLDIQKINCDGPVAPEWSRTWFLLKKDNVDFIGREMELIDAGDYDNNGDSELLFWYSGYDRDGYILIYNDFRESAEYLWGYH